MASLNQPVSESGNQSGGLTAVLILLLAVVLMCTLLSACTTIYIIVADPIRPHASLPATKGPSATVIFTPPPTQAISEQYEVSPVATPSLPTPTLTPVQLAPGKCPATYVVRPGDTVLGLAVQCGSTAQEIARANNLQTTDSLRIGQEIIIPSGIPVPTAIPLPTTAPIPLPTNPLPTPSSVPEPNKTPLPSPGLPTPTLAPASTLPPTATFMPSSTPSAIAKCKLDAWMSNEEPAQNEDVTIFIEFLCDEAGTSGAPMRTTWNFKDQTQNCDEGITDSGGYGSCTLNIGTAEIGYYVQIDITVTWQGQDYTFTSGFTPK